MGLKDRGPTNKLMKIRVSLATVQSPFELSLGGAGAMLRGSDTERATLSQGSHVNWTA